MNCIDEGAGLNLPVMKPEAVRRWISPGEALRRVLDRRSSKREEVYGVPGAKVNGKCGVAAPRPPSIGAARLQDVFRRE
jgi:hypothetical protein